MQIRKKIFPIAVLILLLYLPFFTHLSLQPLRIWDETRQAFNAYEMTMDGDMIVTKYNHQPDMWNLKPPLLVWCQAALMKVFGPWELAVRLPSALSGFLVSLLIFVFSWKYFNRFWLGFIAALIIPTVRGYMEYHGARSGDYDSMLTLFTVFYSLSFFLFFDSGKWKYLYAGMIGLTLAVMTKGVAGLLFAPAIALAAIFFGKVKTILTSRHFYISLLFFLTVVCGYYLLREHYNPSYWQAVLDNELGGRYLEVIEGHEGGFWFYFEKIHQWQFAYWALLIPVGIVTGILDNDKNFRKLILYVTGVVIIFALILSISVTKIEWYIYQIVPLLALLIATFIYYVFTLLEKVETPGLLKYKILPYVFLLVITYRPYKEIFDVTYLAPEKEWDWSGYRMSYYLRDLAQGKIKLTEPVHVVFEGQAFHLDYYVMLANRKEKNKADVKPKEDLANGDLIICSQDLVDRYVNDHYNLDHISHDDHLFLYRVTGRKTQ